MRSHFERLWPTVDIQGYREALRLEAEERARVRAAALAEAAEQRIRAKVARDAAEAAQPAETESSEVPEDSLQALLGLDAATGKPTPMDVDDSNDEAGAGED